VKDGVGHCEGFHNCGPPDAEPLQAARGNTTKSVAKPGDSSIRTTPLSQISACFLDQPIETPGRDICLNLPVPLFGIEFGKPGAESGQFLSGKLANTVFKLLNRTHVNSLPMMTVRRNPWEVGPS
jgi:hypothetical protein